MTKRRFVAIAAGLLAAMACSRQVQAESASAPATQPMQFQVPMPQQVEAEVRATQAVYQVGQPLWVEFILRNLTAEPVTLAVPNVLAAEVGPPAMGLPLAHVFSGVNFGALTVMRDRPDGNLRHLSQAPSRGRSDRAGAVCLGRRTGRCDPVVPRHAAGRRL